jgi:transcriptional regulator with XRE-family HTH domain
MAKYKPSGYLKVARLLSGLSINEVSAGSGLAPALISRLENGHEELTDERLLKFARVLESAAPPPQDRVRPR